MRRVTSAAIAVAAIALVGTPVLADEKPNKEEMERIRQAVSAWGCEGGKYEKESEASGIYEVDDAKCKTGQYDFRLNRDFVVTVIVRD